MQTYTVEGDSLTQMRYVEVSIVDGPVDISSLAGCGANNEVILSDDIVGHEVFPATKGSAYYQLTLRKKADSIYDVWKVDSQLKSMIRDLSYVWPFAGGAMLILEKTERIKESIYSSNASQVEEEFLRDIGKKKCISSLTQSWSISGSYRAMPLAHAALLCSEADRSIPLKKMLKYFYDGMIDNDKWFINIPKVRETLCKVIGNEEAVKCALGISSSDWSHFGRVVNRDYDLRHANISVNNIVVPNEEIARLKELGRTWIVSYLRHIGLEPL